MCTVLVYWTYVLDWCTRTLKPSLEPLLEPSLEPSLEPLLEPFLELSFELYYSELFLCPLFRPCL